MAWDPTSERLLGVPPHLVDPATGGSAWLVEPTGFVVRLAPDYTRVDTAVAQFMMGALDRMIEGHRRPDEQAYWIADWMRMTDYDLTARQTLIAWARSRRTTIRRLFVAIPEDRLVPRMGLKIAESALHFVGLRVEVVATLDHALAVTGVRPRVNRSIPPPR